MLITLRGSKALPQFSCDDRFDTADIVINISLLQHFPLYRRNEVRCTGVDAPPDEEKRSKNREKWEVVSKEMSQKLLSLLRPRLVLSGHTHHGCYLLHDDGTPEMTIPSFSWRNRNNPSFVLVSLSDRIAAN